jgi:phenylacetate-coenzyme A ligase PaaK-like adenylate-forming protein
MTTELSARTSAAIAARMPGHLQRLRWRPAQLADFQRDRLRALLARAIERSPFHAARLRDLDPARFELADLPGLPVMTKAEMMANFDQAVTDPRLAQDLVEQHLAASAAEGVRVGLLLGEYVGLVSGGSSGLRGIFVQTLGEYADFVATILRRIMPPGGPPPEGLVIGMVSAGSPVHSSGLAAATATAPPVRMIPAPAALPTAEIVARLNAAQPPILMGYAAKLAELAREQRDGRLKLSLRSVISNSEALGPVERTAIGEAFGVPVIDLFVSTEGLVGHTEPGGAVFTFASDTCIAECVDDDGRPVPAGLPSSKVLLTNLHNLTQPLIRYELTDRFTPAPAPPAAGGFLRASVDGRADDLFRYGAASVHPFVIGAVLARAPAVREFQVRQTDRGADVTAVVDGAPETADLAALSAAVQDSLRLAGLPGPQVMMPVPPPVTMTAVTRCSWSGRAAGCSPTAAPG